jgi:MFS family permease
LFRIGVGATPFLLPLMLQLGFGLDPFQSGLLTCATAMGAMFMKTLTVRILKRYGFRAVLTANAVLASCVTAGYGLFTATTPHVVIIFVLLFSGCLRSLQFTGLNAITFADVSRQTMSQATSLSSMGQRPSQSIGVVIGAFALQAASSLHGHAGIEASDFWPAFLTLGAIAAGSLLFHLRLPADAGAEVSGHAASGRQA